MMFSWLDGGRRGLMAGHRCRLTQPRARREELSMAVPAMVQALEPRQMLSATPVGPEFQVNTFTAGAQETGEEVRQSIAANEDGDFVITWTSPPSGRSDDGIYAQRYNAVGVAQGSEFRVNTFTTGNQSDSAVAMDADGNFVITWSSRDNVNDSGIFAQRYNAAGVAQGTEFRVNSTTTNDQHHSTVAMDADGDFVVTWSSQDYVNDASDGVYAQRYNAAGVAQGSEFRVNSYTQNEQRYSMVAMDADGDFVVTWESPRTGRL